MNAAALPFRLSSPDGQRLTWRAYLLLILLGLALFLPGLSTLPPVDRDEPRYTQASKQMIETGNYADIRFMRETRYKKPVGIYWLQSASAQLLGKPPYDVIWPYRLPSVLAGILTLCLLAWGVSCLSGATTGLLSAVIFASCFQLVFESHIAKTDAALLACSTGAQLILAQAYLGTISRRLAFLFWLLQAIGILIKGPIAPLVSGCTILALWLADGRQAAWLKQLRWVQGLALCASIVLPWVIWISLASQGKFLGESAGHDLLGKIFQGQDRGFLPPGYHTLLLVAWFLPQAVLILAGLRHGWRHRTASQHRFALAWIIPFWIFYELIATKLPHYVLPVYPALAWLAASAITQSDLPAPSRWWRFGVTAQATALIIAALGLMAAPLWLPELSLASCLLGAGAFVLAWHQARTFWAAPQRAALFGLGAAACLFISVFGLVLPATRSHWLSPNLADFYLEHRPCPLTSRLVTEGYNEPSLTFLSGTNTYFANNPARAAYWLMVDACTVVSVRDGEKEQAFLAALAVNGGRFEWIGSVSGFHYNGGGWQKHHFYRQPVSPPPLDLTMLEDFWTRRPEPLRLGIAAAPASP